MRGQFAVLPLKWDCYLAVGSINLHNIYLNTQLRTIYINIDIIKKIKGKTCDEAENTKKIVFTFIF